MRIACCRAMIAAVVLVAGGSAYAQSPEVRAAEAREETALAAGVKRTNELCGARITATFDWRALVPTGRLTQTKPGALAHQCDEALEGIRKLCRSHPSGRQAAATEIKRMVCSFGSKSPAVSLNDHTLTYMIDLDLAFPNNDIMVYEHLICNLMLGSRIQGRSPRPLGHHRSLSAAIRSRARSNHHRRAAPKRMVAVLADIARARRSNLATTGFTPLMTKWFGGRVQDNGLARAPQA